MDSTELVLKAQNGDNQAITVLYNETYKQAYSVAVQITKNEDEAFDILQDSYVKAFNNLDSLTDKSKFKSWLFQIVSNKCKDYLKSKRHDLIYFSEMTYETDSGEQEIEFEDESTAFSPQENVDYSETKRLIAEMINNLPEDQKLVLLMYYVQELSIKEIAQSLDISENTVKSRMNYGKKKLKVQVEELEKKGTKLYGIAGVALFAFIAWILKGGAESVSVPDVSKVISVKNTVLPNSSYQQPKYAQQNPQYVQQPQQYAQQNPQYAQQPQQYAQQNPQYVQQPQQYAQQNPQYVQQPQQSASVNKVNSAVQVGKKVKKHTFLKVVSGLTVTAVAGTTVAAVVSPAFRRDIDVFGWFTGPDTVIEIFEDAVNNNDYNKLISCFPPSFQKQFNLGPGGNLLYSVTHFITAGDDIDIKINDIEYNESKDRADIDAEIISDKDGTESYTFKLEKISGKWYLDKSAYVEVFKDMAEGVFDLYEEYYE